MKSNSALIIVNEYGKKTAVEAPKGRLLSGVLAANGFDIEAPCGGNARCGKCRVRFKSGAPVPSSFDERFLSGKELSEGYRLLCKALVKGDCEIEITRPEKDMSIEEAEFEKPASILADKIPERSFAVAVDVGTTTIAAALVACCGEDTGVINTASVVNSQRRYGADVISRICAADSKEDLKAMEELVLGDIESLVDELLLPETADGKLLGRLEYITIAGNTTMINLLLGREVSRLGSFPYTPTKDALDFKIVKEGALAEKYSGATIAVMPGISAFVGADIVSGIYYLKDTLEDTDNALFVDLGTNGEMAYFDDGSLTVTSTAAGPVFEAGGISCGVASVPGAICHVRLAREGEKVTAKFKTIKDLPPIGICGTGVLELVSEAVKVGIVDSTGLLKEPYFEDGFPVTEDGKIVLKRQDIRNLQLGKAAISTGAKALLNGKRPDKIYIAGGFGSHIDMANVKNLRMFPEDFDGKIIPVGNTSLKGAVSFASKALLGKDAMDGAVKALKEIAKTAKVINLATLDEFNEQYIDAMNF